MKLLPLLSALSLLTLTAAAQSPRASVQVNGAGPSNAGQVGVASADDLTAICWSDGSSSQVFVATSDGRGVAFGAPVRVDSDAFSKTTQTDSVFVSGNNVYVVWEANSDLYFARSVDRGLSYSAATVVDDGGGAVRDWRVAIRADPLGDHIYVLSSTAIGDEDLFLASSHNAGVSFSPAVLVPSVGATGDVDALAIATAGNVVHIAWDDNRSGRDSVYYQRSTNGGATFLPADISLGDNVGVEDSNAPIELAALGSQVAVMWNEEPGGSGNEVIQVNVSNDAGSTFGGPVDPGGYTGTVDDTDFGHVAIDPLSSNVLVTWEDNRTGTDEAYVAVSTDGGLSYLPDVQLSLSGAEKPRFAGASASRPSAAILWESTAFPRTVEASQTLDAGSTWSPAFKISDNDPDTVDFVTGAYNELYGNFIGAWTSLNGGDFNVYSGGYRLPTLAGQNLVSGQLSSVSLSGFTGQEPLVWVLFSNIPGSFQLGSGDSRDLGLNPLSALFGLSLSAPNLFLTFLDGAGSGSTLPTPNPLPAGFSLFAAAISFDLSAGLDFGELTDVVELTIQ